MKVVLAIWADPRNYLSTIFTAQGLSARGIDVDLVYRKPNKELDISGDVNFDSNTRHHPIGGRHSGWRDRIDYVIFVLKLLLVVWQKRPDVVIGYNKHGLLASFVVTRLFPKIRLIYHNYDFDISRMKDISSRCELVAARNANLTIFPALGRSEEYKSIAGLKREPMSVLNCYPLSYSVKKTGELNKILESKGLSFDRLVVRLGMIGPFHSIKATLRSMPKWKGNWGFVMGGFASEPYLKELNQLVEELGLGDRVLILPSVSNSLWYDILSCGDLGIALYDHDPLNLSHKYMAGTSQKLNGYFVSRIPSVVPNTPDFSSFVEKYGTSKLVDVSNPGSIAQAINSFFEDAEVYDRCRTNVREAFVSEFNFEKQIEPVFKWLDNLKVK